MKYKYYDYKKAQQLIKRAFREFPNAESIDLGMKEDWSWTAEEIWKKGEGFQVDLNEESLEIAGINCSYWATPTLMVNLGGGLTHSYPCYFEKEEVPK